MVTSNKLDCLMPLCQAMKCSTKSSRGFWPLFWLKWILDRMTNSLIGLCHFRTALLPYSLYVWSNTSVKSISCPSFQNALEMPNFWQPCVGENTTILKLVSFVWKLMGIWILMGTEIAKNVLKIKISTAIEGYYIFKNCNFLECHSACNENGEMIGWTRYD